MFLHKYNLACRREPSLLCMPCQVQIQYVERQGAFNFKWKRTLYGSQGHANSSLKNSSTVLNIYLETWSFKGQLLIIMPSHKLLEFTMAEFIPVTIVKVMS